MCGCFQGSAWSEGEGGVIGSHWEEASATGLLTSSALRGGKRVVLAVPRL